MTRDDEWATLRPAHRLSYEALCDDHERVWRGLARARLHNQDLIERAVDATRERLRQNWSTVLRQPSAAFYAWMTAKEIIADLALGAGLGGAPPRAVVPDWVAAIYRAHAQCRIGLETFDNGYDDLYAAILRLPERQYDMIVLRFMLDLDYPRIAAYLGITETNARTTTSQGVAKLRRLLGADTTTTEDMQ
ncbi:RNA polymerase sigma factor [Kitasatospora sp. NPDC004745]|uniref:RNA polymerase sigma factor n=1 Tax=Kitasatospora sp. NPDC004745 TaxID=3364019 RepID=UPI0036D059FB